MNEREQRAFDEQMMRRALAEAHAAAEKGEVPVGAIYVSKAGDIIGRAHNLRETLTDPTAHAEMIGMTQAASALESWRLIDVTCYVTLEPCPMCAGALILARVGRVVFGASDPKAGACGSLFTLHDDARLNHRYPVTAGVLGDECGEVLREFFRARR